MITSVVLGGVDINGGRGTVAGVLVSTLFLWTLRNGMGLANIAGPIQQLVIGALLIASVVISNSSGRGGGRKHERSSGGLNDGRRERTGPAGQERVHEEAAP